MNDLTNLQNDCWIIIRVTQKFSEMVDIQYERFILTNETHSFSNNLSLKPVKMADKTAKNCKNTSDTGHQTRKTNCKTETRINLHESNIWCLKIYVVHDWRLIVYAYIWPKNIAHADELAGNGRRWCYEVKEEKDMAVERGELS